MEATKFTVSIKIEVLSMDSVKGLVAKFHERLDKECPRGQLTFEDGDSVEWETQTEKVKF